MTEDGGYDDLAKETVLLERMRERAEAYVRSFPWAPPIKEMLLAFGASEILALYLVRFEQAIESMAVAFQCRHFVFKSFLGGAEGLELGLQY